MIRRVAKGVFGAIVCFALATLIAEGIIVAYLRASGRLDEAKLAEAIAVLQGIPRAEERAPAETVKDDAPVVSVPYEQVLEARALKDKDFQLRELALANAMSQLKTDQRLLADAEKRFQRQRTDHESKLEALAKTAKGSGRDEVRRILEAVKPKQAKEFVLGMLDNKEEDEVVLLLSGMSDSKRAKLLAEFKTPDENKKIEEVLRRIRQGVPEGPLAERTKQEIKPPGTAGS